MVNYNHYSGDVVSDIINAMLVSGCLEQDLASNLSAKRERIALHVVFFN